MLTDPFQQTGLLPGSILAILSSNFRLMLMRKNTSYKFLLLFLLIFGLVRQNVQAAPFEQDGPPYKYYFPVVYNSDPTPTPPSHYSTSWYMTPQNIVTTYQMGCAAGNQTVQLPGVQDSLVILDFGQPWGNSSYLGTLLLREGGYHVTSINEITIAVQNFINGYMACSDHVSDIVVGIGTSNFAFLSSFLPPGCPEDTNRWMCYENNAYDHGSAWAAMTRNVSTWVDDHNYENQVTVSGANDIELAWNYPDNTVAWVDGFNDNDNNAVIFYNYGACEGCPTRNNPNSNPTLVNGWTMFLAHYTAWRVAPAWPIPEIYLNNGVHARQWAYLSKWGVDHGYPKMIFLGTMTQLQACGGIDKSGCLTTDNTPEEAWYQLFNEVNFWPSTSLTNIPWMTDIDWP